MRIKQIVQKAKLMVQKRYKEFTRQFGRQTGPTCGRSATNSCNASFADASYPHSLGYCGSFTELDHIDHFDFFPT